MSASAAGLDGLGTREGQAMQLPPVVNYLD